MITASVLYGDCFSFHVDAEESASVWKCICDSNGFPQVAADGHSPNCFKACNCTWGTFPLSLLLVLNFHLLNFTCSLFNTFFSITDSFLLEDWICFSTFYLSSSYSYPIDTGKRLYHFTPKLLICSYIKQLRS